MNEFLKQLLLLSLSGSLLFLLLLLFKRLYKDRLSKRWQYYIFLTVTLRFLLPFAPDAALASVLLQSPPFHAVRFIQSQKNSQLSVSKGILHFEQQIGSADTQPSTQRQTDSGDTQASARQSDATVWLFFLWLAVALLLLVKKIAAYCGFLRYIKTAGVAVDEIRLLNLLASCEEASKAKRPAELYYNPHLASPVLAGFFHPCIAIPDKELPEKELSLIFTHELYHYRRRDMFYKWLIQVVVCIHWFNPLVYLLEREVSLACELSCDEAVIRPMSAEEKKAYGDMLLYCSKAALHQKTSASSLTLTEGAKQLKERLGAIMRFQQPTKRTKLTTALLTATVCFGSAVIGAYAMPARPAQALRVWPNGQTQSQADIQADLLPKEVKKVLALKVKGYEDYTLQQFLDYIGEQYEADSSLWNARQKLWKVLDEKVEQCLSEEDASFLHTTLPCTESESTYPKDRAGAIPPDFSVRYELPYAKLNTTVSIEWAVQYEIKDPKLTVGQRDKLILNVKNGMDEFVKSTSETADIAAPGYLKKIRSRLGRLVRENSGFGLEMTVFQCVSDGKSAS